MRDRKFIFYICTQKFYHKECSDRFGPSLFLSANRIQLVLKRDHLSILSKATKTVTQKLPKNIKKIFFGSYIIIHIMYYFYVLTRKFYQKECSIFYSHSFSQVANRIQLVLQRGLFFDFLESAINCNSKLYMYFFYVLS